MIIGTPLHKAEIENTYDAIVIGSGIGGLTTAACLAKAGKRVLVLERHYTAGGFTHTYMRKGYEWDVGVHYIGEAHRKESVLRRVFDYVSNEGIEWQQMSDVYDRIYIGDESYDFVSGREAFREKLHQYFPEEKNAIDQYLDLIRKVNRASSLFFMEKTLPSVLAKIFYKKLTKQYLEYAQKSTEETLLELTSNRKLIAVLTGQWGDYGLPPKESSFVMHAMVAKHYLNGAAYPVGGSSSIASKIVPVIEAAGGQVITRAEVDQVLIKNRKAFGVKLSNGSEIKSDIIVSATGVINTFNGLIPKEISDSMGLDIKLKDVKPSSAHISAYIGLKIKPDEICPENTNMWIYKDEHHDKNIQNFAKNFNMDFPLVYISFPSSKDPKWLENYPGKSTIEIVVPTPYQWFEKWQDSKWQKRGDEYKNLKEEISQSLLESLYEKLPHLRGKIDFIEISTPLSTAHFSNYKNGEIYGIDHDPKRFKSKWLRTQSPIKNLYLTGQDIVTCGIGGALSAGVLTSIKILGPLKGRTLIKLMKPIRTR